MNSFTLEETKDWWRQVLSNEDKLKAWLQKLYKTELEGYTEHLLYLGAEGSVEERTAKILLNIALDELKHSHILANLMKDRGYDLGSPPASTYWKQMNSSVKSLEDYCAVNHFGESLAAFRFEVIHSMPETPEDIASAIEVILPDEQFHKTTLYKLAGDDALSRIAVIHDEAVQNLKRTAWVAGSRPTF